MKKFYRVLKDNFLWETGAIIENSCDGGGYVPVDPIFVKYEGECEEYVSAGIIENCPEYFERVYPVHLLTKTLYKAKKEAQAMIAGQFE